MQYTEFSREKFLRDEIMILEKQHYRCVLDAVNPDTWGYASLEGIEKQIAQYRKELTKVQRERPNNGGYTDLATRTTVLPSEGKSNA